MDAISQGSRVVFPVTTGGPGRERHRTIYREGTVVSTRQEGRARVARIREDSDRYARGHGYVTRAVAVLVTADSLAGQQRLAAHAWAGRCAEWERAGQPPHPWRPLVPGAAVCWQCPGPEDFPGHRTPSPPPPAPGDAPAAAPRTRRPTRTSSPGTSRDCDYVDGAGQAYPVTVRWSVTHWYIATVRSPDLASAAGGRPFTSLTGHVLDPDDDDPDAALPTYLDDLAADTGPAVTDGWEISSVYDARRDQPAR